MPLHPAGKLSAIRTLRLVLLAVVLAVTIVTAALWWRDRPLGEVARRLGEPGGAKRALEAADAFLARHPDHERALVLKGRALADLGRWDEASQIFSQVGVHSPAEMRAWATALVNQRRFREAMPLLERLLKSEPNDPVALRHVTACRFQVGLTEAALDSAAMLSRIDGHDVEGLFLSGVIHRARGDTNLSVETWERLEGLRPDGKGLPISPAEFFLIYGEDLLAAGLPQTASIKLQKSRGIEDNPVIQLRLGKAWAISGDVAGAAAAWKRALEQDADSVEARQGLAELALSRSAGEEALQWLMPIASRPDVSSATAYLMERAHTLLGNEDDLEHWQRRTAALRQSEKRQDAFRRKLRKGL